MLLLMHALRVRGRKGGSCCGMATPLFFLHYWSLSQNYSTHKAGCELEKVKEKKIILQTKQKDIEELIMGKRTTRFLQSDISCTLKTACNGDKSLRKSQTYEGVMWSVA